MVKKKNRNISIFLAILVLGLISLISFSLTLESDYNNYDDFTITSPAILSKNGADSKWNVQTNCEIEYQEDTLRISSATTETACTFDLTTSQNMKGYDLLTDFVIGTNSGSQASSEVVAYISLGRNIYTASHSKNKREKDIESSHKIIATQNRANQKIYNVEVNGKEVQEMQTPQEKILFRYTLSLRGGYVEIDHLKFRPFFNCEVESDEVIIKDTFSEGSFTINDLSFRPLKFCSDSFPVIIRDTEKGITSDLRGDITKNIARGEHIQVPEGRVYSVGYIADYQKGMQERCALDTAYNTQKKRCEKYIEEKEDVIEVVREVKFIEVGNEEIIFENEAKIGDTVLTSGKPEFVCQSENSESAPNPQESCWLIPISYQGQDYKVQWGKEQQLNSYVKTTPYTNARFKDGSVESIFTNTLKISLLNKEFLDVNPVKSPYFVIKDQPFIVNLTIDNKLANFEDAGVKIDVNNILLNKKTTQLSQFPIKLGDNNYAFSEDSSQFGKFEYKITPFVKIGGKYIFDDQELTYNFEVVDEIPKEGEVTLIEKSAKRALLQRIWEYIKNLFKG